MMPRLMRSQAFIPTACLSLAAVIFLISSSQAAPTLQAPAGGVAQPINQSAAAQTKAGALTVHNTVTANNMNVSGALSAGSVCLPGGGCRNSWPSASYSTPNINQVLDAGSDASGYTLTFSDNIGFSFGGGTNKEYRDRWPNPTTRRTSCYSRSVLYLQWTYCNSGDLVYGVNTSAGGPTIYCCSLDISQ